MTNINEFDDNAAIPMDGEIDYEGSSIIPEGEYLFQIASMKREQVQGTEKMPNHLNLKFMLRLSNADGPAGTLWDNLRMYRKWLWKYNDLAKSIGHTAADSTKISIDWDSFVGSEGRVQITISDWKKNDGTVQKQNNVKYLLPSTQPPDVPW